MEAFNYCAQFRHNSQSTLSVGQHELQLVCCVS